MDFNVNSLPEQRTNNICPTKVAVTAVLRGVHRNINSTEILGLHDVTKL